MTARPKKAAPTLAAACHELARRELPFRPEADRAARFEWPNLGLTPAQSDKAVDELIVARLARLVPGPLGITVEPVPAGES